MKNYNSKFYIVFLAIILSAILVSPTISNATIFLSEDWDSGTPPDCWPCKYMDPPEERFCWTAERYNGWEAIGYLVDPNLVPAGRSIVQKHSGNYSYYNLRPANSFETCSVRHFFDTPYPTVIYIRYYFWLTPEWAKCGNADYQLDPYNSEFIHWIFTNSMYSGVGWRINILDQDWWGSCDGSAYYAFFRPENGNHTWEINCPDTNYNLLQHLEEWISVEIKMDATNKLFNVWINGVKQWNSDQTDEHSWQQNDFTFISFSGFDSFNNNWQGDFYIDDIVVSDSYIGPMGTLPDTTPPAPPSGVKVS